MESRLDDLEVRYSYLERSVRDLDQVVLELRAEVDRLKRQLAEVHTEAKGSGETPPNEKPPHY